VAATIAGSAAINPVNGGSGLQHLTPSIVSLSWAVTRDRLPISPYAQFYDNCPMIYLQ
jgi:hypothetical protein